MKTLPLADLLQQWQSKQLTPETTIAHLIQNAIELHQAFDAANILPLTPKPDLDQNDNKMIKQAIPPQLLLQKWQFDNFPDEPTTGHILYNLVNIQRYLDSIHIQLFILQRDVAELKTAFNLNSNPQTNPNPKTKKKSPQPD